MSSIHCYTSASFGYLDRACVLAETVRRYHADWILWLCLSDEEPPGFHLDLKDRLFDHAIRSTDLGISGGRQWIFGHDVVELCTAVKGAMLQHMFSAGADQVVYIDPDVALFNPLVDVVDLLAQRSIVLTPHILSPELSRVGILDNEISCLKHGVYNLGFLAVRKSREGVRFADWWANRLLQFCWDDVPNGLFTDQRWCDLVPALFDEVAVLRDPGYNVASWNLADRPITFDLQGGIFAGEHPLRFFHFTKVNSVGEAMLERYSYGRTEVFELLRWYRERLEYHMPKTLPPGWWGYARYEDGTPIPRAHRVYWRNRDDLHDVFADPFEVGPKSYRAWCEANGV